MPQVTGSIVIETDAEPIWELMCDPGRYPDFVENTDRMLDVGTGEFGVGSTYKEYGGLKPFLGESEWKVTEFDPMRHQTHIGDDGKVEIRLDLDLEPSGDGTRLTLRVAMKPRWFIAPVSAVMWPLVMRSRAQADIDQTTANDKRILEAAA